MEIISHKRDLSYNNTNMKRTNSDYNDNKFLNYKPKIFINKEEKKLKRSESHVIFEKIIKLKKPIENTIPFISTFRPANPVLFPNVIYHKKILKNSLHLNINKTMISNNNNLLNTNITNNIFILDLNNDNKKRNDEIIANEENYNIEKNSLPINLVTKHNNKEKKNEKKLKNYCSFNYERTKIKSNKIDEIVNINYFEKNKKQRNLDIIPIKSKYLKI